MVLLLIGVVCTTGEPPETLINPSLYKSQALYKPCICRPRHVHRLVHIHTDICIHLYLDIYIYIYVYINVYIYIYILDICIHISRIGTCKLPT